MRDRECNALRVRFRFTGYLECRAGRANRTRLDRASGRIFLNHGWPRMGRGRISFLLLSLFVLFGLPRSGRECTRGLEFLRGVTDLWISATSFSSLSSVQIPPARATGGAYQCSHDPLEWSPSISWRERDKRLWRAKVLPDTVGQHQAVIWRRAGEIVQFVKAAEAIHLDSHQCIPESRSAAETIV